MKHIKMLGTCRGTHPCDFSPGDPILIYFAGHGTTADAPDDWTTGSQLMSLIVPYDCDVKDLKHFQVNDMRNRDAKHPVYPIPDRTLGALLHILAEKRGDNIVDPSLLRRLFVLTIKLHRPSYLTAATPVPGHETSRTRAG